MSRFTEIERYACVSTGYVETADLELLLDPEAPGHTANHDELCGSYFYIPAVGRPDDVQAFEEHITECLEFGLCLRLTQILRLAHAEDIAYINFDRDGGDIEGMELLEEEGGAHELQPQS